MILRLGGLADLQPVPGVKAEAGGMQWTLSIVESTIEHACGPPIRRPEHVCCRHLPNLASLFTPSSSFVSLAFVSLLKRNMFYS